METRALIFDFDGTLAELNIDFAAMKAEVQDLARRMGLAGPWPSEGYLLEQVEWAAEALGNGFAEKALALITNRELASARLGRLFPFTPGLLARARALGLGLAIVSRNCGAAIRLVFPEVDSACDLFLPREAAPRPKPDPSHLAAALDGLGVSPAQAAVVGDHPIDVTTARTAGCLAVGVASGRVGPEDLARAGAGLVLADARGLLEALGLAPGPRE